MPHLRTYNACVVAATTVALHFGAAIAGAESVPISRVAEHVGKEVTVEGRVLATHASPLATVLAFAPNFAGFTATILAADRAKFPADIEGRYRDKVIRVKGVVTAYRGKPEMTIREPAQLVEISAPDETPPAVRVVTTGPTPAASPDGTAEETRRILTLIEERLGALEARLAALEQSLAARAGGAPAAGPALAFGLPAREVRTLLGDPVEIARGPRGGSLWLYGGGRSVTFDRTGKVVAWAGF